MAADETLRHSAELGVLAAAMMGTLGHDAICALEPDDFASPRHRLIATVVQALVRREDVQHMDWMTVGAELDERGELSRAGGASYLSSIVSGAPVTAPHLGWEYAKQVRKFRRAEAAAAAARELAKASEGGSLEDRLQEHTDRLAAIPPLLDEADGAPLPTIADLFKKRFEHRWLVPGLLGRRERVVITAAEGVAKTTSLSTWAICLAAGIHPYTGEKLDRTYRVLLLDAENDEEQTQHRFNWIGDRVDAVGGEIGWGNRISHQIRPEGFDIVGRDRAWFFSCLAKSSPDLLCVGPAYKMMGAAKASDDAAVMSMFATLDKARVEFDLAMLIEAHAGHSKDSDGTRELRPFGSSVWLRWPEVGIALQRNKDLDPGREHAEYVDVKHWRGSRGKRNWPDQLRYGREGELPWVSPRPDYGGFDPITKKWR